MCHKNEEHWPRMQSNVKSVSDKNIFDDISVIRRTSFSILSNDVSYIKSCSARLYMTKNQCQGI